MTQPDLLSVEDELRGYPGNLSEDFRRSAESLSYTLTPEQLAAWANECLMLAHHSLRAWEATGEYLRASPLVLTRLSFDRFLAWVSHGRDLADLSASIARSYFKASPATLALLPEGELDEWARLGSSLYKGTWKSISLAGQFLELSPRLLAQVDMSEMRTLVAVIDDLAERSYDLAFTCLESAAQSLAAAARVDRPAFLGFASVLAKHTWADTRIFFERGPGLVNQIEPSTRSRYLRLVAGTAPELTRQTYGYFAEGSNALARIDPALHASLVARAEPLAARSGMAAMEFVKSAPEVL
ncbi:MAG TPA: hypothetical protein VNL92_01445, partial [Dehalococcoidia bacterium]|nr:hypothetical protein [Dehalococcoidia bacterium]